MATLHPSEAALLSDLGFLRKLALSLTRDQFQADDLAQQTSLIALERGPADLRSPRAWLRRVMKNVASNVRRSAGRRREHEAAMPQRAALLTPDEHAARKELLEAVVAAVLRLEEPFGMTVIMRFYDGLSPKEIAARLDLPEGTVRSRLSRGLAMLRENLDRRFGPRDRWAGILAPATAGLASMSSVGTKAIVACLALLVLAAPVTIAFLWPDRDPRTTAQQAELSRADDVRDGAAALASAAGSSRDQDDRGRGTASEAAAGGGTEARTDSQDPEPAPIRGVVVDAETGAPIAGAALTWIPRGALPPRIEDGLNFWDEAAEREAAARALRLVTGARGEFELPGTAAVLLVIARHGDRFGFSKGALGPEARIRLAPDRSDWIEVVDHEGQPRAGVPVAIKRRGGPVDLLVWRGVTGGDGRAEIRHAQRLRSNERRTGLVYGLDIWVATPVEAPTTDPGRVRLELIPTATVRVHVKGVDGSAFGAGAEVTIRARGAAAPEDAGVLTVVTDATGWATFPHVAASTGMSIAAVDPTHRHRAAPEVALTTPDAGGSIDAVVRFADPMATLARRALDARTGQPLAGRNVFVRTERTTTGTDAPTVLTCGPDGVVRVPVAVAGAIELMALDDRGMPSLGARIDAGEAAEQRDLPFQGLPVLATGIVRDAAGAKVAGVNLWASRVQNADRRVPASWIPEPDLIARSAADGRFVMRGVTRGTRLAIRASGGPGMADGVTCDEGARDVEVRAGAPLRQKRVAGVRGSVILDRDVPLDFVRAALTRRSPPNSPMTFGPESVELREMPSSEAERVAEFVFPGLEPGAYGFSIQSVGGGDPVTAATFHTSTSVTTFGGFGGFEGGVPIFTGPDVDLTGAEAPGDSRLERLDLRGKLQVVNVRATKGAGKPVKGAEVTLITSETPARKVGAGTTDAEGRALVVTSRGALRLVVRAPGHRSAVMPLGDGEQVVALGPGIPVKLVARPSPGDPRPASGLWARVEWTADRTSRMPMLTDESLAISRLPQDGRVPLVDLEGTVLLPAPGDYRVTLSFAQASAGQIGVFGSHAAATDVITVRDSDAEQVFEIALEKQPESRPKGR